MDTEKMIKISCKGADTADFKELLPMQGGLKSLTQEAFEKLKSQIISEGFTAPVFIWIDSKDQKKILDGHQRVLVLKILDDEGYVVPPIPICHIFAKTEKEAKKKLLGLASSYGRVESEGLYEFMEKNNIELDYLTSACNFHEIDEKKYLENFYEDEDQDKKSWSVIAYFDSEKDAISASNKLEEMGYKIKVK